MVILTDLGQQRIADALANGTTVQISELAVGDGVNNLDPTQTSLVNERWRGQVQSVSVDPKNPAWVDVIGVVPASVGGFTIREIGIFDSAGDLIAVGTFPETYKPDPNSNSYTMDLEIRAKLEVSDTSAISIQIDPNVATASVSYVDQSVADKALQDLSNVTSLGNLTNLDGPGSGLDADTVDGLDASAFARTDLSNVTSLGNLTNLDGAGSGLDADTVDGKQYSDIKNEAFFFSIAFGG